MNIEDKKTGLTEKKVFEVNLKGNDRKRYCPTNPARARTSPALHFILFLHSNPIYIIILSIKGLTYANYKSIRLVGISILV